MMYGGGWSIWGWAMMAGMVLFWIAVIVGIVALIRWTVDRSMEGRMMPAGGPPMDSAVDLLRRRFAQGEITADQFREMRRELEENRPPAAGGGRA